MIASRTNRLILALTLLVALSAVGGCSRERGNGPKAPPSPLIYAGGLYYTDPTDAASEVQVVYVLNADSLTFIDSLFYKSEPVTISATPDGRTLLIVFYTEYHSPTDLVAIDAASKDTLWTAPGVWQTTMLQGSKLTIASYVDGSSGLVNVRDGTVIRTFGDSLDFFYGKNQGTEVVTQVRSSSPKYLAALNPESQTLRGMYHPRLSSGDRVGAYFAMLHPDGNRVLALGPRTSIIDSWFVIGDLRSDSTLFQEQLLYPSGEIAISDDGRTAAVSDPSNVYGEVHGIIDILDLVQMKRVRRFVQSETKFNGQVRFIPGENKLATYPGPGGVNSGPLQVIDLKTLTVESNIWLPAADTVENQPFINGPFEVAPPP